MRTYYGAEAWSVVPFAGVGVVTGVAGSVLAVAGKGGLEQGAGWPLLSVGVLEIAAGVIFNLRARGPHVTDLSHLLDADRAAFLVAEQAHLQRITTVFQPFLLVLEAAVTVLGSSLALVGAATGLRTIEGVGLGVGVQGLALFLLDWAVLDRSLAYGAVLDAAASRAGRDEGAGFK
jgi:hypothetical protein